MSIFFQERASHGRKTHDLRRRTRRCPTYLPYEAITLHLRPPTPWKEAWSVKEKFFMLRMNV